MMTSLLIAIAAGIASALMFASLVSGAIVSLLLFYLAPLPLMVVALGWGATSALIGGILAAISLGLVFGFTYMVAFALTVVLPAWWLGHLTLLARPVSSDPQLASLAPVLDWYPVGRILTWITAFAILTTISALLTLGFDETSINAALRQGLLRVMSSDAGGTLGSDREHLIDALVSIAPGAATIIAMMTLTLNLWLAAKITSTSGRLQRPWPELRTTTLPSMTIAALVIAIALCFVGGLVGMFAQIASSALMIAYAMTGFAVLHTLTQAFSGRTLVLSAVYAATLFIGWPLIGMISLGLADAIFGIRQNYLNRRGPSAPTS